MDDEAEKESQKLQGKGKLQMTSNETTNIPKSLCPKCGHLKSNNELECPKCGIIYEKYKKFQKRINEEAKADREEQKNYKFKQSLKKGLITLVLLIISVVGVYLSLSNKKEVGTFEQLTLEKPQFVPIEEWVGEKFIFLPKPKSLQKYGYQLFGKEKGVFSINFASSPTYAECVERIGTIVKVESTIILEDSVVNRVTILMEDNNQIYYGFGDDTIDNIAPIADLDYARTNWKGKTLWSKKKGMMTYDVVTDEYGEVRFDIQTPLKVVDVVVGWYSDCPVRFLLKTPSGEEGHIDVHLSDTNVPDILRDHNRFENYFFTKNPE